MSIARSFDVESAEKRAARARPNQHGADPMMVAPLEGPAAMRPAALLQRQAVLGNAHTGRIFRSPAGPMEGPEGKKECSCAGDEECSCPK